MIKYNYRLIIEKTKKDTEKETMLQIQGRAIAKNEENAIKNTMKNIKQTIRENRAAEK